MKSILYKEFVTLNQEKPLVFIFAFMAVLWGILQPLISVLSQSGEYVIRYSLFETANFSLMLFFLMLCISYSNQSFLREKNAHTLNTLLAMPIRTQHLILGKTLAVLLLVGFSAGIIYLLQFLVYKILFLAVLEDSTLLIFPDRAELLQHIILMVLAWTIPCWSGSFCWLRFDSYQASNLTVIFSLLPIMAGGYFCVHYFYIPLFYICVLLAVLSLLLGVLSVKLNTRDRLTRLG